MQNDPIVEETREIRNRLAAKFKYDLKALGAYYQAKQTKANQRVVTRKPKLIITNSQHKVSELQASFVPKARRVKNVSRQQATAAALY